MRSWGKKTSKIFLLSIVLSLWCLVIFHCCLRAIYPSDATFILVLMGLFISIQFPISSLSAGKKFPFLLLLGAWRLPCYYRTLLWQRLCEQSSCSTKTTPRLLSFFCWESWPEFSSVSVFDFFAGANSLLQIVREAKGLWTGSSSKQRLHREQLCCGVQSVWSCENELEDDGCLNSHNCLFPPITVNWYSSVVPLLAMTMM